MLNWKKILQSVGEELEERAARQRRNSPRSRPSSGRGGKVCSYWDCDKIIHPGHTYCHAHYIEAQDGKIDDCPKCGRGKHVQYDLCMDCNAKAPARAQKRGTGKRGKYEPERSEAWDKADAGVEEFFVYILKLDGPQGAEFYAGQTRELRERLSEHRDGGTKSTAGRNPKLVWFQVVPTREIAAEYEVELKKLIDRNPREIRRRVIQFQDLVKEVEF